MNNIQIFKNEQIIPLKENDNGEVIISGRELHEFLKVQQDFSDWIKKQLELIGAQENKEYSLLKGETSEVGGRPTTEYVLTIDIAKEICMIAGVAPRTNTDTKELSKKARQYFIQIEKAWNSPEMIMKRALEIANKKVNKLTLENEEKTKQLEHKEEVIVTLVDDISLAEKRQVLNRVVRYKGANFQERWRELYKQFEMKYHLSLRERLERYNLDHKPKLKNKVDYIDKVMNKIPELYEIACKLYENDVKELANHIYDLN